MRPDKSKRTSISTLDVVMEVLLYGPGLPGIRLNGARLMAHTNEP